MGRIINGNTIFLFHGEHSLKDMGTIMFQESIGICNSRK